ncbi:MAG: precorrin-6A reductase [Clostridia bacterium]|nr:precorrin-6A reductase [Clostridia bacterium]
MAELVIFGGTAEGRQAALAHPQAVVCVTSAYARELLPAEADVRVGRLNPARMLELLQKEQPKKVIDATHPYALQATANIAACCRELGIPLERVSRPVTPGAWRQEVQHVASSEEAARAASNISGNILLTTGSHTLSSYTAILPPERLWARVLPTREALGLCEAAGLPASHIIAMQGPFSAAFNAALYDQLNVACMVTKDSGQPGGVEEKVLPALQRDIHVIMIDRPKEETCAERR